MSTLRTKSSLAALVGLGLAGTLAACGSPAGGTGEQGERGEYTDGEYTATGSYESPHGTETIDVALTLADNVITDVEVTTHPTDPNVERFQGEFAGGIAGVVVGKNIDEIVVDKVAGSSLTSGGFKDAIEQIKDEAAS